MNRFKRWRILFIIPVIAILLTGCLGDVKKKEESDNMLHHIEIEIKDYGTIKVELDEKQAPITVRHFIDNINKGIYNGTTTFHRNIKNFMIQGGNVAGTEYEGTIAPIKGEFANNGVAYNNIKHERGTISMARTNDMNSATTQFFICQVDYPSLDGNYAAFGHVTEGIEIVDKILENTPVVDNNGTTLKEYQPVINKIVLID